MIPLQPTDDIKKAMAKINNTVFFEMEHLLSDDFWKYFRLVNNIMFLEKFQEKSKELLEVYRTGLNKNEKKH